MSCLILIRQGRFRGTVGRVLGSFDERGVLGWMGGFVGMFFSCIAGNGYMGVHVLVV